MSDYKPFLARLLETIEQRPDAVFCWYYDDTRTPRTIRYGDLPGLLAWRERAILEQFEPGALFFIIHDDAMEQILWWLAALLAGVVPGILTPPTPKLDLKKYLNDLRAILAAYGQARVVFGGRILDAGLVNDELGVYQFVAGASEKADDFRLTLKPRGADVPLVFQQSSGTTGLRKGILLSEQAVVNQLTAYAQAIQLRESDVIVSWLPLYHDMGLVACLMQAVYWAMPLAITSPFVWLNDPGWLFRAVRDHQGSLCWLPNFAFNLLSERVSQADFKADTLASLRLVVNCSETVLPASLESFRTAFMAIGLKAGAISSSYAMAENTFGVTQSPPGDGVRFERLDAHTLEHEAQAMTADGGRWVASSGAALPDVEIKIVREGTALPDGHLGDIWIRSSSLMNGYFGVGETGLGLDAEGWFATGDIGYLRDGELYVLSRKKDLIIRGGRNLYPADIEDAVNKVTDVKAGRTAAFGLLNEREGTEDIVVMAEFGGGRASDVSRLKQQVYETLSRELDLAPQRVEIVRPNWLVKSSSGKISRGGCRDKYQRMVEARQKSRLFVTEYGDNLTESDQDSFSYFGRDSKIRAPLDITAPGRIEIGNWVVLGRHGKIYMLTDFTRVERYARQHFPDTDHHFDPQIYGLRNPQLKIGDGTNIGDYFFIACALSVEIGQFVLMSDRVFITDSMHNYANPDLPIAFQANTMGKAVVIGDHSWIGINCCIMEGVTIGKHAVISANSVVTQDVPDYAVVAGNPARVVRLLREPSVGRESNQLLQPKEAGSSTAALTMFLLDYFRGRLGFVVKETDSLFRSGLVDSLGSLDLVMSVEQYTGRTIDEVGFFNQQPDTIADVVQIVQSTNGRA